MQEKMICSLTVLKNYEIIRVMRGMDICPNRHIAMPSADGAALHLFFTFPRKKKITNSVFTSPPCITVIEYLFIFGLFLS